MTVSTFDLSKDRSEVLLFGFEFVFKGDLHERLMPGLHAKFKTLSSRPITLTGSE